MIKTILKHKNHFWLLVAMLVAFALRVYALSAQSLWNDEGTSVALSQLSLEAITNGAARDIHPPLYYYFLHFWMMVVDNSEFAVRFLSVIAGVLTVAVTFRIAYVFFDEEVAIIAAYLSAFSPFQVYYSQETRMYIWVTLWAAVSVYAMTMMLKRVESPSSKFQVEGLAPDKSAKTLNLKPETGNSRSQRSLFWLLYVVATTAMLYTQYVGAFVVVAENIAFVVWLVLVWRDRRNVIASRTAAKQSPSTLEIATSHTCPGGRCQGKPLLAMTTRGGLRHSIAFWLIGQLVVGSLFLPWYLFAGGQLASWPSISEPLDLPTLLWRVLNVFSVGTTIDAGTALPVAIAFGVLFFIGWRKTRDANANWVVITLILWALVPVAAMFVVSLSRPAYNPKFLLLATPPFFILCARGLSRIHPGIFLHRREGDARNWIDNRLVWFFWIVSVLAAVGPLPSLRNYYFDAQYARDDYRGVVQFIDANARAGDGLLVNAPAQIDAVRYYWRGDQQLFLLPTGRPPDATRTRAEVDAMLGKVTRLFAIYYATQQSDPQGIVETRLAENAFKARDEWRGNIRLAIYGVTSNPRGTMQSIDAKVGDEIVLVGCQIDQREARAGDVLTLMLNWRAAQTPSTRYKVFVHLLDANGQVVAQRDGEPVGDTRITTSWRVGESIADNYGIFIEPGTPPGEYKIEIGMYRAETGERLRIGEGDSLVIGIVRVQ